MIYQIIQYHYALPITQNDSQCINQQLYLMPKFCILFALLVGLSLAQCPATLFNNNIASGLITLVPSSSPTSPYTFVFQQPFTTTPQVALGITSFTVSKSTSGEPPSCWLMVQPSQKGLQVQPKMGASGWTISRVCFIAAVSSELVLDVLSSQFSNSGAQQYQGIVQFKLNPNGSPFLTQNIVVRTFLAGVNASASIGFLSLGNAQLQGSQISQAVLAVTDSSVTQLWISIAIFPQQTNSFAVYGGLTTANSSSRYIDLFQTLSDPQNAFYGLNGISLGDSQAAFSASIDQNFLLNITAQGKATIFQLSYFFMGYRPESVCVSCGQNGQGKIYSKGQCVMACPPLAALVTVGQGQVCRSCPSVLNLGYQNGQCSPCPEGTVSLHGGCIPIALAGGSTITQSTTTPPSTTNSENTNSMNQGTSTGSQTIPPQASTGSTASSNSINGGISSGSSSISISGAFSGSGSSDGTSISKGSSGPGISQTQASNSGNTTQYAVIPPLSVSYSSTPSSSTSPVTSPTSSTSSTSGSSGSSGPSASPYTVVSNPYSIVCPLPNMFYNGDQCLCQVGYILASNICIKIYAPVPPIIPIIPGNYSNSTECSGSNQFFNGTACVCISGYYLSNGICLQSSNSNIVCPINSSNNGLGMCICTQNGYEMVGGTCLFTACTDNKTWNGSTCACPTNFFLSSNGSCQPRCPAGQLWSVQGCLMVCGANMQVDSERQLCVCVSGFGMGNGVCQICPSGYFINNGYCVTCPQNALYSSVLNSCTCQQGFRQNLDGTCSSQCPGLQIYNQTTGTCSCRPGLGLNNGVCTICPSSSYLINGNCAVCPPNSASSSGKCVCSPGYIFDSVSLSCQPCASLPNTFTINGYCATCPGGQVYSASTGQCVCPSGSSPVGGTCVRNCGSDELLDSKGDCYSCANNMVISGGKCVCVKGYQPSAGGCGCQLSCGNNQFVFMGGCAQCPMNMVYMSSLQGCVCPSGSYLSPIYNICVQAPIITACTVAQYYDNLSGKCASCSENCINCTAANSCSLCTNGYRITFNGSCQTFCGDGLIIGTETCDPGINPNPGCIGCAVTPGYNCTGQPSICQIINIPIQPNITADSLTLSGKVNVNSNNVFLTLASTPTFTFPTVSAMQSFIQVAFKNSIRPTVYCQQQPSPRLNLFDCLLIYPSGVPNNQFSATFSYNYNGHSASTLVLVDPLSATLNSH